MFSLQVKSKLDVFKRNIDILHYIEQVTRKFTISNKVNDT